MQVFYTISHGPTHSSLTEGFLDIFYGDIEFLRDAEIEKVVLQKIFKECKVATLEQPVVSWWPSPNVKARAKEEIEQEIERLQCRIFDIQTCVERLESEKGRALELSSCYTREENPLSQALDSAVKRLGGVRFGELRILQALQQAGIPATRHLFALWTFRIRRPCREVEDKILSVLKDLN